MIPPSIIADCQFPIADCIQMGNWQLAIENELISSVRKHRHHAFMVRCGDEHIDVELTLSLVGLLGQYVSRMRMASLDLSAGRQTETLRCAFVCFKFRHY
jgi:hypothetical protein